MPQPGLDPDGARALEGERHRAGVAEGMDREVPPQPGGRRMGLEAGLPAAGRDRLPRQAAGEEPRLTSPWESRNRMNATPNIAEEPDAQDIGLLFSTRIIRLLWIPLGYASALSGAGWGP